MNHPELSIILVSYNTADYTVRALRAVFAETEATTFEVIVVDNQSGDNSVTLIREHFPQVRLIESGANLGFAGGVSIGIEASKGDYVLMLNPDTVVLEQAIDRLMAFAHRYPEHGIWGGVTLNNDLSLNTQHAWARPDFSSLLFSALGLSRLFVSSCFFNHVNYGCWDRQSVREVDIISGCFFLTRRSIWNELGGFDPAFFMYAEEADFCLRAIQAGYQPVVTPEARIIHHGGVSHHRFSGKQIKLLKGKVELINRHVPTWKKPVYRFLLYLYVLNKYLSHRLLKSGTEQAQEWNTVFEHRTNWLRGYR